MATLLIFSADINFLFLLPAEKMGKEGERAQEGSHSRGHMQPSLRAPGKQQGPPGSMELTSWGWACHHSGHLGTCSREHKATVRGNQTRVGHRHSTRTLALTINNLRKRNNS